MSKIERKVIKYPLNEVIKTMEKICKKYKIKLIFAKDETIYNAACSSGNEITIYQFNGKNSIERQFIAFFHEFAHCKLSQKVPFKVAGYNCNNMSSMQFEIYITILGMKFAKEKYEIVFSDDAVQWMIEQSFSYRDNERLDTASLIVDEKEHYVVNYEQMKNNFFSYLLDKIKIKAYCLFYLIREIYFK